MAEGACQWVYSIYGCNEFVVLLVGQQQQLPVDVREEVTSLSNKTIWTVHYGTRRVRETIIINLIPFFVFIYSLLMILFYSFYF